MARQSNEGHWIVSREWKALWLVSLASAVSSLDVTLMFVAYPEIIDTFSDTPATQVSWVISGYNIMVAALLIPAGRLADRIGHRRVFLWAITIFVTGSAAVGLAPNAPAMIAARCYQAFGGSSLITSGLALVMSTLGPQRRAIAVGVWASVAGVLASLAPTLGGLAIELASWRAAFFLVAPVGLAVLARRSLISESVADEAAELPDVVGVVLAGLSTAALVLGIVQISEWGSDDPRVIGAFAAAAIGMAAFLLRCQRHPSPVIDLALFRHKVFASTALVAFLVGTAFYGIFLALVQFLRGPWDYTTLGAGLLLTPLTAASSTVSFGTGRIMERFGHRVVMVPAAGCIAVGCLWVALFAGPEREWAAVWFPAVLLMGFGVGTVFPGVNSAIAFGVPPSQLGLAAGTVQTVIRIGGAVGVAAGVAILGGDLADYNTFFTVLAIIFGVAGVASLGMVTRPKEN